MDKSLKNWMRKKKTKTPFFRPLQVYLIDVFITFVDLFCQPTLQFEL